MIKIRQHYVWRKYLEAWGKNNQVCCHQTNDHKSNFQAHTKNIAVEKYFYNINDLDEEEIKEIINTINYDKSIIESENKFRRETLKEILDCLEKEDNQKKIKNNFFEDKYMLIENNFSPILEKLLKKDISFYKQETHCYNFLFYITSQYMRTKAIKEQEIAYVKKYHNKDISRTWNILSYITAHSICSLIFSQREKRKLYLLENKSDVDFLTSDQPVINLAPSPKYCLYFPVSPKIAILLQEEDEDPIFQTNNLNEENVDFLNEKIIQQSSRLIFSLESETPCKYFSTDDKFSDFDEIMKIFLGDHPFDMTLLDDEKEE